MFHCLQCTVVTNISLNSEHFDVILRVYKVENCFFFNFVKWPVMVNDRPFAALNHLLGYTI